MDVLRHRMEEAVTSKRRSGSNPRAVLRHTLRRPVIERGARVIEKHFTLNKALPGPDHICSATPEELAELCRLARLMAKIRP